MLKIDYVASLEKIKDEQHKQDLIHTRRNYVEYAFSLDDNWELVYLLEEISSYNNEGLVREIIHTFQEIKFMIIGSTFYTYLTNYR